MRKNRRKIIIMAGIMAVVFALCTVLACGGNQSGKTVRKAGQEKLPETAAEETVTEETRLIASEDDRRTVVPETAAQPESRYPAGTSAHISKVPPETESTAAGFYGLPQETEGEASPDIMVYQETQPRTEPAPKPAVHEHNYEWVDTRKMEHPEVSEQVWVEDSPAWDEVIRDGYHVCVVTCHECGAQFSDVAQANALEAWGDHIDAAHDGDGGYDMAASYDVPPEVIHHEAIGHYETWTVIAAWTEYIDTYRCSCGEQYTKTR